MSFDDLPVDVQNALTLAGVGLLCYVLGGLTAWLLMHKRARPHALRVMRWAFGDLSEDEKRALLGIGVREKEHEHDQDRQRGNHP